MAVRLKYAEIKDVSIIEDYNSLLETGLSSIKENETLYILPSYTALLEIRSILEKKINIKEFWK